MTPPFMRFAVLLGLTGFAAMTSGCSQLLGGLRHDMNDQQGQAPATYGGQWPEHGWLDDDMSEGGSYTDNAGGRYDAIGHSERNPASAGYGNTASASSSWVSQDDATANQRDAYRGVSGDGNAPSFASAPNMVPPTRRLYKNGSRATAADFVDDAPNEGSLWASNGQTNYYFTKNRIRGVGDIVSIKVEAPLIKDVGAEIQRTLTADEKDAELQSAQGRLNAQAAASAGNGAAPGATAGGPAPASARPAVVAATDKDIDVTKSIDIKAGDAIMAEIVERYPNGNYKIRGSKKIIYSNGTPRLLTFVGVARGSDIGEDDTISSGKLYEYRLEAFR